MSIRQRLNTVAKLRGPLTVEQRLGVAIEEIDHLQAKLAALERQLSDRIDDVQRTAKRAKQDADYALRIHFPQ